MLCSECQTRDAQVYLKQIINNQVTQRPLCPECADRITGSPSSGPDALLMQVLSSLGSLLTGAPAETRKARACATCGLPYAKFQESGRLGCAECYESFREPMADLLRRVHGSEKHRGKLPRGSRVAKEREQKLEDLQRLRKELKAAIDGERFEEAAAIRDRIQRQS